MRFTIHFKDENGWPMMSVDQFMQENKDSVRIQNYALDRFKDFTAMCQYHRQVTKEAKQAIKEKKTPKGFSLSSIFHDIFTRQDNERILALEKEVRQLKQRLSELDPDKSISCTGC